MPGSLRLSFGAIGASEMGPQRVQLSRRQIQLAIGRGMEPDSTAAGSPEAPHHDDDDPQQHQQDRAQQHFLMAVDGETEGREDRRPEVQDERGLQRAETEMTQSMMQMLAIPQ